MSQWTHVKGCIDLSGSAAAVDHNNKTAVTKYYLPYPDEQLKLSAPKPTWVPEGKTRGGIDYRVKVYCLPRCKEIVDSIMKLFPSGENNIINYSLYQPKNRFRLSRGSLNPWEENIVQNRILRQYQDEEDFVGTWEELKDYYNINIGWVDCATDFTLTISDDLRYCSGVEFLDALEKGIVSLKEQGIEVTEGIIDWADDYTKYKFQCIITYDTITFRTYDPATGTTIASKIIQQVWNKETKTVEEKEVQTENWKELMEELDDEKSND